MSFDVFCMLYTIVISTYLVPAAVQTDDNALMFIIIFIFTTVPYRYVNVLSSCIPFVEFIPYLFHL